MTRKLFILFGVLALLSLGGLFEFDKAKLSGTTPVVDTSIRAEIAGKTPREKANIKGQRIASIRSVARTERATYSIQVVSTSPIEGGVEVFARAWNKQNQQLGFGADGTVDIERFRIFNPPILVPDPNGDILQEWTEDVTGLQKSRRLREDPKEALLQVLEHTISVKKEVFVGSNIIQGKVGRTTSTFYPAAGAASPVDGKVDNDPVTPGTWAAIHDATAGTTAAVSNATIETSYIANDTSQNWNRMIRGFFLFDTSSIGSDTVSAATFSLYGNSSLGTTGDSGWVNEIALVSSSPAANDNLVTGDYDQVGATKFADTNVAISGWNTSGYNDWSMNATGIAAIATGGVTKLATIHENDRSNTEPTKTSSNQTSGVTSHMADETGTTQDSKLVVEHASAGGGDEEAVNTQSIFIGI